MIIVRIFKSIIGIALFPVVFAAGKSFYNQIILLKNYTDALLVLERGALAYLVFHVFIKRPAYLYVFAHEIVHVIATWICGGRVQAFNITPSGGNVVTSKTNFFIELSPYFIPFYTILLAPVFLALKWIGHDMDQISTVFLFLVGVTLTFHFAMTSEVLRIEQSDVGKSGVILSMVIIFLSNIVITMAVFCPFFTDLSFSAFIKDIGFDSKDIYMSIYTFIESYINPSPVTG